MSTVTIDVRAKRVYDAAEPSDGYRVLIDHVGRAASPTSAPGWTSGRGSWHLATSCANGLATFPSASPSFALATAASLKSTGSDSRSCAAARARGR